MRILIQRVREASVDIGGERHSAIGAGMLVLTGIEEADTDTDVEWLCGKLLKLRIFDDEAGVMNRSAEETGADILIVSQFAARLDAQRQPAVVHPRREARKGGAALRVVRSRRAPRRHGPRGDRRFRRRHAGRAGQRRPRYDLDRFAEPGITRDRAPPRPAAPEGQRTAPARKPHAASGGHKTDLTEQR